MSNKQTLQDHNVDLQTILQKVLGQPTANSWGGSSIIEVGEDDIIIPAYTDTQLTIKGVTPGITTADLGYSKVYTGSFTPTSHMSKLTMVHTLGSVPDRALFYTTKDLSAGYFISAALCVNHASAMIIHPTIAYLSNSEMIADGTNIGKVTFSSSNVDITLNTTYTSLRFAAGATYRFLIMGN